MSARPRTLLRLPQLLSGLGLLSAFATCGGPTVRSPGPTAALSQTELAKERETLSARAADARNARDPVVHRDYGLALLISGDTDGARLELEKALPLFGGGEDPRTLLGLGLIAQEAGQQQQAQDLWLRLIGRAIDPAVRKSEPWAAPLAELAAHRLLALGTGGTGRDADRKLRERVLGLLKSPGEFPVEARQLLSALAGQLVRLASDEQTAQALDVARGCPASFYVSGPVGHLPMLDLSTAFAADDPGRDPARAKYKRRSGYGCSLTLDGLSGRPGVMHAATWFYTEKGGELPVIVESGNTPFAIYVDGKKSYLETDPPRRRYLTLQAGAGWHSLVLKVGLYSRGSVQLSVPGVRFHSGASAEAPATSSATTPPVIERRPLSPLPTPTTAVEGVLAALFRGQYAFMVGDTDPGLDALIPASQVAPKFASLKLLQAGLLLEDRVRPERQLRDQARALLDQVVTEQPKLLRARLALANLLLQDEHPDQALELLDATPAGTEPHWTTQLLRYRILKARSWNLEAEKALQVARQLGPTACPTLEALVAQRRELQDARGALAAAAELATCNPYSDSYADALVEAGQLAAAQKEHGRLLALEPENDEAQRGLADDLMALRGPGELSRSKELLTELVQRQPRNTSPRMALANVLIALGDREQARAVLRAGLAETPESAELERALLSLGEREAMAPYRIDGREVIRSFLSQNATQFEGEPAVLLLDRTVVKVLPNGARLTLTHNIIRVLTKDGLGRFGEVSLPSGAEVLMLRTIKADGTTREPEEIPEKDSISAPDLEVGDFVEFEYLDREEPLSAFPRAFLAERFYFASTDAPLDRSEYVLIAPADLQLAIDTRGPEGKGGREVPEPTVKTVGDERIYTYERVHVPRMRPEPPMAESIIEDWMPSVRVGAGLSFATYVDFLRDRRAHSLRVSREVRALVEELLGKPMPGQSDDPARLIEKARKLDEWVRRNIRQGGGLVGAAPQILAQREGRRDILLLAMLKAAGIPAELWLVRPRNRPHLDGPLPDVMAYSEAVVAVAPGQGPGGQPLLFLDPAFRHSPSGYVRPMLRGGRALRVSEVELENKTAQAEFATVDLPESGGVPRAWQGSGLVVGSGLADARRLELNVQLERDGSGEVKVRETLSGMPAIEWREQVEHIAEDKLRQELEQRGLGFYFPGASLLELRYGPMDRDDAPLVVEYRLHAPRLARMRTQAGISELVLPAQFPILLSRNYVAVARRSLPLLLQYLLPTTIDTRIGLPKGARIERTAPPLELSEPGRFVQRAVAGQDGRSLEVHVEAELPLRRIAPEQFPAFVEMATRMDAAQESVAVIAVP